MKNILIKSSITSLVILLSSQLWALDPIDQKELLQHIKHQTKLCIVQIVSTSSKDENEKVLGFKSICKSLKILSPYSAQILIDKKWLNANISESSESDGGDLDDLVITNIDGITMATKTNIPAYDSVLVAMAGDSDFKKIYSK